MSTNKPAPNQAHNGVILQSFEWYTPADGKHWERLAQRAAFLADAGFTAIWLPPAYKGFHGSSDVGYAVYDMYDLGEFDQKGSVRTKYGTREEFLRAVKSLHEKGLQVYLDTVFNHRMGGDATEEISATPFRQDDRLRPECAPRTIQAYTKYLFAARQGKYSAFTWNHSHFDAVDYDALRPQESQRVYLLECKTFDDQVSLENGNYAYLMGTDLDCQNPEVRLELENWGKWILDTTGNDGFRLDAVKHIATWFFPQWIDALEKHVGKDLFVVGEYWQQNLEALTKYIDMMQGRMSLFDVTLHYNFHQASKSGGRFDMRRIFTGTLVQERPAHAVTFVDNHDSQPLQALESCVEPWFKPLAYAMILLRKDGYPCVFEADYYGAHYSDRSRDGQIHTVEMASHQFLINRFLWARRECAWGVQIDYFDHFNRIGWTRLGDAEHPRAMAVLLSDGLAGSKWMDVGKAHQIFTDITGHDLNPVVTNSDGWGEFRCPAGSLSVWVENP